MENEQCQRTRHAAGLPNFGARVLVLTRSVLAEPGRELLSLEVECGSRAPAVVRAALGQIKELGSARDDVLLVASELVTNAVVHSGGSSADTIRVRAVLIRGAVSISVHDPGLSGDSPRVRGADGWQADGWGLRIVKELAHRWGFEGAHGRRVWAELRLPSAVFGLGGG